MDKIKELEQLEELENPTEDLQIVKLQAPKKKRQPSEKQLANLKNMREKLQLKAKENQIKKQLEQEEIEKEVQRRLDEERKILEAKILKKAISIKKKEIKKRAILEEISDDDTPMEKIKEIASKPIQRLPPAPVQPKYIYV